ncbi:MAG TPA: response regulator [Pyrinomonadaceae bacterium]|jgi:CheY-like chemotaxis protein
MPITKTVLLVEDNEDNSEMLEILFAQDGFEVTICTSGEDCLRRRESSEFSAIVLDYHLPEKDGLEICREIRAVDEKAPIVFFTADARETIRREALDAGADAFLLKPDDLPDIVAIVAELINSKNRD